MKGGVHLISWLYLAKRSDRQGAPVLIWERESREEEKEEDRNQFQRGETSPAATTAGVSAGSTCLSACLPAYLSSAQSDHQVRDEGVFGFSGAMTDHHTPPAALSQLTPERQTGERTDR